MDRKNSIHERKTSWVLGGNMKVIKYRQITPRNFEGKEAKHISGRVVIGKQEGADHFCMRLFVVEPEGCSPRHAHDWEHEIFIHSGKGEVYSSGAWTPIDVGDAIFIPANEEHQIRNNTRENLVFLCMIPAKAPEL
jgi:quercetin dioxygenase-like cupin family protein